MPGCRKAAHGPCFAQGAVLRGGSIRLSAGSNAHRPVADRLPSGRVFAAAAKHAIV